MSLLNRQYRNTNLRGDAFWARPIKCPDCKKWVPRQDFFSIYEEDGKRCNGCCGLWGHDEDVGVFSDGADSGSEINLNMGVQKATRRKKQAQPKLAVMKKPASSLGTSTKAHKAQPKLVVMKKPAASKQAAKGSSAGAKKANRNA